MNKNEALSFLIAHQPMPDDEDLTQELIDKYDEVRKYFIAHPEKQAIPLFLNSYGNGDGLGVYQVVEDLFYQFESEDVIPQIRNILEDSSTSESVRYWVTQLAAAFPDDSLKKGLELSLKSNNDDIIEAAQLALDIIEDA